MYPQTFDASLRLFVARTNSKLAEMRDACDWVLELAWAEADNRRVPEDEDHPLLGVYRALNAATAEVAALAEQMGVRP